MITAGWHSPLEYPYCWLAQSIRIVGLFFLAVGLFLKLGSDLYKGQLKQVEEAIESASKNSGAGEIDITLDLGSIVEPVAYTLIGIGVLVLAICIFGCCGACYKIKCLLVTYFVIVLVMMAGEIVLVVLLTSYPSVLKTSLASALKSGIQSDYEGITGKNLNSVAWNVVMQQFKCCGVENYKDFNGASKWNYNYTSVCGNSCILQTPMMCCKTLPSGRTEYDYACATNPMTENNYMNSGCLDAVWNPYLGNTLYIGQALGLPLLLQGIFVMLSIVILCDGRCTSCKHDKSDKQQNNDKNTDSGDSNNNKQENSNDKGGDNMFTSRDMETSGEISINGAAGLTKAAETSKMKHNSMKYVTKNQTYPEPKMASYLQKYFRYSRFSRFRSNRNKIYPTP
ncbi:hypothetical protein CHS0354_015006 [Potamilus streckersoni]|uniref:Tetraspanin n=1 Tax=Potamilus streckersoni TaxID=2493646 RepID=A0AAE0VZC7_9BIVA|nr:hypothetical protein CHS0354_015006 [Potamilus streckersoni]